MSTQDTELAPVGESALESSSTEPTPDNTDTGTPPLQPPRVSALSAQAPKHARISFSRPPGSVSESPARYHRRPSRGANSIFGRSSVRRVDDNDAAGLLIPPSAAGSIHERERPAIPSALNPSSDATPLPILSMIVLSIVMLGEFLSANVSTPFVLKMVQGFFENPSSNPSEPNNPQENEADSPTGMAVAPFFVSLLGNALTCTMFGFATNLPQAIVIRLAQGVFNGAVGVARGTIASITDSSNEGRAYAIMGRVDLLSRVFSWGFGGVAGAIIGGALESPTDKWPGLFTNNKFPLFVSYPYLLPCFAASCVTGTGAILSLFLGWDAGPRSGLIRLPDDTDADNKPIDGEEAQTPSHIEAVSPSGLSGISRNVSKKFSGYFARRVRENSRNGSPVPLATSGPGRSASVGIGTGTAYGYRSRLGSVATSMRRRRESIASAARTAGGDGFFGSYAPQNENIGLAQRLLMANEHNVTNMTDLWVAAAITADNEEVFEDWDSDLSGSEDENQQPDFSRQPSSAQPLFCVSNTPPIVFSPELYSFPHPHGGLGTSLQARLGVPSARRASSVSSRPAIFANTGLSDDVAYSVGHVPHPDEPLVSAEAGASTGEHLAPIIEGRPASSTEPNLRAPSDSGTGETVTQAQMTPLVVVEERPGGALSQLPVVIIFQYGLLALHNTTHDQIFLSYLVSKYKAGGLELDPGHFAQLIALMCLAQIAFQFYLYPNIGPPLGRFSHLAMFRIGCALFIPSYLSVVLYRHFASEGNGGSLLIMILLSISTAIRYCGTTFSYTSVAVLLNYMSPPQVVSLSNGMAQSIVSLARFIGPVFGGYVSNVQYLRHNGKTLVVLLLPYLIPLLLTLTFAHR
ncbi:major facilitator superfamily transporter [Ceratobasidium sp. AG-Ba]|nr:major facilitator superfamily transporter [Ceratobasidium sp. AG-Ba]